MSIPLLLQRLKGLDIKIELLDDELKIKAPKGVMNEQLLNEIKSKKPDIIEYIKSLSLNERYERIEKLQGSDLSYPLSHAQKRLWIMDQLEEDLIAYNMYGTYYIKGKLDLDVFASCFSTLINRHEILRTIFISENDEPKQHVLDYAEDGFSVDYVDVRSDSNIKGRANDIIEHELRQKFDLRKAPLFRAKIIQLYDEEYVLIFTMHHIISDGWSIGILINEVIQLYKAKCKGMPHSLPVLEIQYKDYTAWQNNQLETNQAVNHQAYWLDQLKGELPVFEFPSDYSRPPVKKYKGEKVTFKLDKASINGLNELSKRQESTLFATLLTVTKILFYRYTSETDIIIGTPVAGRNHYSLENQIGLYVNMLPLRTKIAGSESFEDILKKVQALIIDGYNHQIYPFDKLIEDLHLEREMSRSPLFDVAVVLGTDPMKMKSDQILEGLSIFQYPIELNTSQLDLRIEFNEYNDFLHVAIDYNIDLYKKERIQRFCIHFGELVKSVLTNSKSSIDQLNYLSEIEKYELIKKFNDTETVFPKDKSAIALFEEQVNSTPHALAISYNGVAFTYTELNEKANKLAHYLIDDHKIGNGKTVSIMLDRSIDFVIGLLGVLKTGAAYLPIDASYPEQRINYILNDSGTSLILTDSAKMFSIGTYKGPLFAIDVQLDFIENKIHNPDVSIDSNDLVYVIYTSGSTGNPKGVEVRHRSLVNLCHWHNETFKVKSESRASLYAGIGFDASAWELWPYLLAGAGIFPVDDENRLVTDRLISFFNTNGITHCFLPTAMWDKLNEEGGNFNDQTIVLTGGDELLSKSISISNLVNNYGPTEATVVATSIPVSKGESSKHSIGKPIYNTQIYILDNEHQLVPVGVTGEICISGEGLAKGYVNDDKLTQEKFISHPYREEERLYKTGDLARWNEDGTIAFVGRKDNQFKLRGFRIELSEIEQVLNQHNLVATSLLVVSTDSKSEKYLVAYIKGDVTEKEIRKHMKSYLPGYMIPSYFVMVKDFPLTPNGKIDRQNLPLPVFKERSEYYVPPANEVESYLVELWQEVLDKEKIGIEDDFFALGGHSLRGVQIVSRIAKKFNVRIELKDLLSLATISALSHAILQAAENIYSEIPVVEVQDYYEASFAQKGLWVIDQLKAAQLAYVIPSRFLIKGNLNINAFFKSFDNLLERHEILRTTFMSEQGELKMRIHAVSEYGFRIEYTDLAADADSDEKYRKLSVDEPFLAFDLQKGPLLRGKLVRMKESEYIFLFTMHHIISDGWSFEVLINDLFAFYDIHAHHKLSAIEPLRIQYKDYAAWHNKKNEGQEMALHREYWLSQLQGNIIPLDLPTDYIRPKLKDYKGDMSRFEMDSELADLVKAAGHKRECSLFTVLYTALSILLYKYTGKKNIVIGTSIAGRDHLELENQIGLYLNTLTLKMPIDGAKSIEQTLIEAKEIMKNAYEHSAYPFESLMDELKSSREINENSLFDVLIMLQNTDLKREVQLPDLTISTLDGGYKSSKLDLSFIFKESKEGISTTIVYNTSLFSQHTVSKIYDNFNSMLQLLVKEPDKNILDISLSYTKSNEEILNSFINPIN